MKRHRLIVITLFPPRVYVLGRRVHHAWAGVLLVASDWRDRRVWVRDLVRHPDAWHFDRKG